VALLALLAIMALSVAILSSAVQRTVNWLGSVALPGVWRQIVLMEFPTVDLLQRTPVETVTLTIKFLTISALL
jgi:hypothetical protein